MMRSTALLVLVLLAALCGGCASTKYVPTAMQRQLPKVPPECETRGDPTFPRVTAVGGVADPADAARWGVQARHWGEVIKHKRSVCAVYARRMREWK